VSQLGVVDDVVRLAVLEVLVNERFPSGVHQDLSSEREIWIPHTERCKEVHCVHARNTNIMVGAVELNCFVCLFVNCSLATTGFQSLPEAPIFHTSRPDD
jgi:hypothetical protein